MQSPESDGSRHPGKHSPQSDGSRHGEAGEAAKVSFHKLVFFAGAISSSTSFVCPYRPLPFYLVDMPTKKAKKTAEEKRLLAGPCHICEKKGCQIACLHYGISFHPHCDKHNIRPNGQLKTMMTSWTCVGWVPRWGGRARVLYATPPNPPSPPGFER